MKLKNIFWHFLLAAGVLVFAIACDENSDEEISEWNTNYIYLQRNNYLKPGIFSLRHTAEGIIGEEVTCTFKVKAKMPVDKDVKVFLSLKSDNIPFENIYLSKNEVTIKAGQTFSEDITISVLDWSFAENVDQEIIYKVYVIIEDIQTDVKNVAISKTQNSIQLNVLKETYNNLIIGQPSNSQIISNRSNWTITLQDDVEGLAVNLIDGKTGTDVARNNGGFWLTIDLGEIKVLTGIKTNHWGKNYAPSKVEIFKSDDGITWKSLGVLDVSGSTQYITFISPVQTRYLKYEIIGIASSGRTDITEFNIYELIKN